VSAAAIRETARDAAIELGQPPWDPETIIEVLGQGCPERAAAILDLMTDYAAILDRTRMFVEIKDARDDIEPDVAQRQLQVYREQFGGAL
jgi:hypothetical protein